MRNTNFLMLVVAILFCSNVISIYSQEKSFEKYSQALTSLKQESSVKKEKLYKLKKQYEKENVETKSSKRLPGLKQEMSGIKKDILRLDDERLKLKSEYFQYILNNMGYSQKILEKALNTKDNAEAVKVLRISIDSLINAIPTRFNSGEMKELSAKAKKEAINLSMDSIMRMEEALFGIFYARRYSNRELEKNRETIREY